jgi:oligopeptide/dipeptide ABC transporter ATP-binding protein
MRAMPLLTACELRLTLPGHRSVANPAGVLRPVDGVSFAIDAGESVALVGESGSGKSLTASSIIGLTRALPGAKLTGELRWSPATGRAVDLVRASERELAAIRGSQIGMVFQDPLSCLNPLLRVGYQIVEVLQRHCNLRGKAARSRALELLEMVEVPHPEMRFRQYPHQLSGGLRQRVLLAVALAASPKLLIADEPTTALDVTIQAQVIETLRKLQRETGLAILFITHDLGVVAQLCSRVLVMYAGRIVEQADVADFFSVPSHPYGQGLLGSLPALHFHSGRDRARALSSIGGSPPSPGNFPQGCRFHPRCRFCTEKCVAEYPPMFGDATQQAACWHIERAREHWRSEQLAEVR